MYTGKASPAWACLTGAGDIVVEPRCHVVGEHSPDRWQGVVHINEILWTSKVLRANRVLPA